MTVQDVAQIVMRDMTVADIAAVADLCFEQQWPHREEDLQTLAASPTPPQTEPEMRRWGLDWQTRRPVGERIQVSGQAWLGARDTTLERFGRQTPFLQLPAGVNPRTLAWARAQRSRPELAQADARTVSQALLQHIRTEKFVYTLAPDDDEPAPDGRPERHLIDRFWLDRRTGFCEHFASAFATLARAAGLPARIVVGFQGGEFNAGGQFWLVRSSDAHAWTEVWLAGRGWVRVDPTGAVSPSRTTGLERLAVPGGLMGQALGTISPALSEHLRATWDAMLLSPPLSSWPARWASPPSW